MKVIGLSGAQGAGKSTLLKELMARGWRVDNFRVSRAVQAQLGWETLDRVMDDPNTMMEFQNEVLRQKASHDNALTEEPGARTMDPKGDVILTERTFADIVAYTTHWTWELLDRGKTTPREAAEFLNGYVSSCVKHQATYSGVLLLPYMRDQITWQDDPNRAKLSSVDSIYEGVERFTQHRALLTQKRYTITAKTISDRADQVEAFLRTL